MFFFLKFGRLADIYIVNGVCFCGVNTGLPLKWSN